MTNGPDSADAPRRSRRAAGSGTAAGAQERESQQRARDREALRAYKALTDSQPRPEPTDANPPTRRQLRLAQQAAQRAAQQQETPAAPEATGQVPQPPAPAAPAGTPDTADTPVTPDVPAAGMRPASRTAGQAPVQPGTRRERRRAAASAEPAAGAQAGHSASTPASAASVSPAADAPVRTDSANPAKAAPAKAASAKTEPAGAARKSSPDAPVVKPVTPAPRRAPSVQERPGKDGAVREDQRAQPAAGPNADVANMSVEQALAAREALKHQARNQVAAMEAMQQSDPNAVDLELLAQQRALAERAAVLNRRTQNIQRLAQENEQRRSAPSDPTTAHNLAMVTPLEFVDVPGLDRPVMKPPPTSHVPVVTSSTPAARKAPANGWVPGRRPGADRRPAQAAGPVPAEGGEVRHARILARADALVNAPLEADQGAKPVGARSAFGLDPLDVMTAGLGRTRRIRFVSLGIVGVGLIALTLGVLMIVGGLGS